MTIQEKALKLHKEWNGKLETVSKTPVKSREDLSLAYTPGVAEPCKVIAQDNESQYRSRCFRRKRSAWSWQYRPSRSTSRYGRKSRTI